MQTRPLSNIAHDIKRDWKEVNYAARHYLSAMLQMDKVTDAYMYDTGKSIVRYFLANAGAWRGPVARVIKDELKQTLKGA
jgi:hypothetical protein